MSEEPAQGLVQQDVARKGRAERQTGRGNREVGTSLCREEGAGTIGGTCRGEPVMAALGPGFVAGLQSGGLTLWGGEVDEEKRRNCEDERCGGSTVLGALSGLNCGPTQLTFTQTLRMVPDRK